MSYGFDIGKSEPQISILVGAEHAARQAQKIVMAGKPLRHRLGAHAGKWMSKISEIGADAHELVAQIRPGQGGLQCLRPRCHHLQFLRFPFRQCLEAEQGGALGDMGRANGNAVENLLELGEKFAAAMIEPTR